MLFSIKRVTLILMLVLNICVGFANQKILIVGDSLSASYGVPLDQAWVTLLEQQLSQEKISAIVVNASITGDTTTGGLARMPALLTKHKPNIVIIELGGNDGLRGTDPKTIYQNLNAMIKLSQQAGATVLLIGIHLPPNYGPAYNQAFYDNYTQLAKQNHVSLVPFLLDGVYQHSDMMQADGIHPSAIGQPVMLKNVWPVLAHLLRKP